LQPGIAVGACTDILWICSDERARKIGEIVAIIVRLCFGSDVVPPADLLVFGVAPLLARHEQLPNSACVERELSKRQLRRVLAAHLPPKLKVADDVRRHLRRHDHGRAGEARERYVLNFDELVFDRLAAIPIGNLAHRLGQVAVVRGNESKAVFRR
jgi:hypothetical protein